MDEKHEPEIVKKLNEDYTGNFKNKCNDLRTKLYYNWESSTISENSSIILTVDLFMKKYSCWNPVACTWHDIGPEPFDGDFMASYLDDYNDMVVVIQHPSDPQQSLDVRIKKSSNNEIEYEFGVFSDNYMVKDMLFQKVDSIVQNWK